MQTGSMRTPAERLSLVVRAGGWLCAIPAQDVVETMRPLPIEPVRDAPPFVRGVSVIRGEPLPVVDLGFLLRGTETVDARRFVTVRTGERRVALAVDEVVGVWRDEPAGKRAPPLLAEAVAVHVERLAALDAQTFAVLNTARLLPVT